ncbi:MAG: hypothetical protein M3N52_00385 [Actinomycetota bacterium]|nr:hypothetical protein [Actinomycetota bacterium]
MTGRHRNAGDESLLDQLRAVVRRLDPVPAHVTRAARLAFGQPGTDAELADLVEDTAAEHPAPADGHTAVRRLRFAGPGLTIDLLVSAARHGRHLRGRLLPPGAVSIDLRRPPAGTEMGTRPATVVAVDEAGCFDVPHCPRGPVRLCCRVHPARPPVQTDWVTL